MVTRIQEVACDSGALLSMVLIIAVDRELEVGLFWLFTVTIEGKSWSDGRSIDVVKNVGSSEVLVVLQK